MFVTTLLRVINLMREVKENSIFLMFRFSRMRRKKKKQMLARTGYMWPSNNIDQEMTLRCVEAVL